MKIRIVGVIIAGFLTVSIAYSIRYAYGMLLPEMLPALSISKTQAGSIYAAYFLIYTIFTPALGVLSDMYSYRILVAVFTAILGLGGLLMAFASGFIQAAMFFSLAAFGHAACWAPVMVLVQKWVPDQKRGAALSIVAMGVGCGIFLWGVLLPVIVNASGWRSGWIALGVTGLVIAVIDFCLVRNPQITSIQTPSKRRSIAKFFNAYQDILKQSIFWKIGIAYLFVGFNVIVIFSFLPVYAREVLNLSYSTSTRLIAIVAIFGIVGQLTLGPLSDFIGRAKVMLICSLLLSCGCFGILFVEQTQYLYLLTAVYGLGYGAVWPIYAAAAPDWFSRERTGGVIGIWTLLLGMGSMIAPVICGWIVDNTGSYKGVYISATLAGILSIGLLISIPKTLSIRSQHKV